MTKEQCTTRVEKDKSQSESPPQPLPLSIPLQVVSVLKVSVDLSLYCQAPVSSLEQLRHRTMSLSFLPMGMKFFFPSFGTKNTICVLGWVVVPHDDSCRLMLGKIDSHRKGLDIQISRMLIVDTELKWHAAVNQRELVHGMEVVSGLPSHVKSVHGLETLLCLLDSLQPCIGNSDSIVSNSAGWTGRGLFRQNRYYAN